MKRHNQSVLILTAIMLIGMISGFTIFAQEGERGLTISPLTFELTANPGDVLENKIQVSNPTKSSISVKMETEDFLAYGELGEVRVQEQEDETYSLKKWVATIPSEFTLSQEEVNLLLSLLMSPKTRNQEGNMVRF